MIKDVKLYNKIATAFNSNFGSSGPGGAGLTFNSIKFDLIDENTARAKCVQLVTFPNVSNIQNLMKDYEKETLERIKASLKKAKKNFEELNNIEGVEKKSINLTLDTKDSTQEVEYISVYSAVKRGFYKYSCLVKIS